MILRLPPGAPKLSFTANPRGGGLKVGGHGGSGVAGQAALRAPRDGEAAEFDGTVGTYFDTDSTLGEMIGRLKWGMAMSG
jgi:hypothetical protein